MKTQVFIGHLLTALILLFSSELMATAQSDYEQGVKSYKEGDIQAAVTYFESAQKQGMVSISLHYNLASSYYRLGRYREAKEYFMLLNQTVEMRDIVDYHLGLIAVKEKDGDLARRYFNSIVSSGKDEKLIKLSKKHLTALTKKEELWKSALSLNLGFDNNISSVTEDSVLDESDSFTELYASSDFLITGSRKDGWIAKAALYVIDYSDTDTNNGDYLALGLKKAMKLEEWDTNVQFDLIKSTYGDDDFQSIAKLNVVGKRPMTKKQSVHLRYQAEDIKSDQSLYDYLEGWRQRARVEYREYSEKYSRKIYYELELNDRGELVTSTDAYDYSPTRHTLRGTYTHFIDKQWWLTGDLSYRLSDFSASPTIDREDTRWKLALTADYYFDRTFKLSTNFQYIDNASTVDRYSYDKSIIKFGLSKLF